MGESLIVRKGGGGKQALAPTITEVSTTETSITFTITNNDALTAVILWEVDDATPDENSIELATGATSSNLTITGLDDDETYIVYATANVTGKIKSNVAELSITTDPAPTYIVATGGTTAEYDDGGKRYKSHTFNSNGTFEVTAVGNGDRNQVEYLIIAGGGGGGGSPFAGGGGGGYRTTFGLQGGNQPLDSKPTITATSYSATIGAGGSIGGNAGTSSSVNFPTTITSTGGGGGLPFNQGGQGGRAGGTSGYGFFPGNSLILNNSNQGGGGGGGAGAKGTNATNPSGLTVVAGNGGNGRGSIIRTGSNENRAGGGRGVATGGGGTNGLGGGGTANTGGGGAGNSAGGSGIVVIRYEITPSV